MLAGGRRAADAAVLDGAGSDLVEALTDVLPGLLPADWSTDRWAAPLRALGVRRLSLAELTEILQGLDQAADPVECLRSGRGFGVDFRPVRHVQDAAKTQALVADSFAGAPDTFFPRTQTGPEVVRAKAICTGCPVRRSCLDEALRRIPEGIAGGLTAAERRRRLRLQPQWVDANELARTARTRTETATAGRLLLAAGRSRVVVARTCGVSERTVYRWSARTQVSASPTEVAS